MRRTEPLPKMYVLQYTPPKATWDRVENPRARTTSVSVSCACRQSGPEAKRKQVFSGSDGGLSTGVWTGRFTGFSTTSSALTLWILSEHAKPQPACCALPLLLYSTQHLHPFTGLNDQQLLTFPFLNEDIIMDGWPVPGAASLWHIPCLCGKCFIQS